MRREVGWMAYALGRAIWPEQQVTIGQGQLQRGNGLCSDKFHRRTFVEWFFNTDSPHPRRDGSRLMRRKGAANAAWSIFRTAFQLRLLLHDKIDLQLRYMKAFAVCAERQRRIKRFSRRTQHLVHTANLALNQRILDSHMLCCNCVLRQTPKPRRLAVSSPTYHTCRDSQASRPGH